MTRRVSPRLAAYAGLAGMGLLAGLVLGRVELVALAAPFALAAVAGAALSREPDLHAVLLLDRERALEGGNVTATIELTSASGSDRLEVLLQLPRALRAEAPNPRAIRLRPDDPRTLELPLHCVRFGAFALGPLLLRSRDRLGFTSWETRLGGREEPTGNRRQRECRHADQPSDGALRPAGAPGGEPSTARGWRAFAQSQ